MHVHMAHMLYICVIMDGYRTCALAAGAFLQGFHANRGQNIIIPQYLKMISCLYKFYPLSAGCFHGGCGLLHSDVMDHPWGLL
jgi:hypothetical protein